MLKRLVFSFISFILLATIFQLPAFAFTLPSVSVDAPATARGIINVAVSYNSPDDYGIVSVQIDVPGMPRSVPINGIFISPGTSGTLNLTLSTSGWPDDVPATVKAWIYYNNIGGGNVTDTKNIVPHNVPYVTIVSPSGTVKGTVNASISYDFPSTYYSYPARISLERKTILGTYTEIAHTDINLSSLQSTTGAWNFTFDVSGWVDNNYALRAKASYSKTGYAYKTITVANHAQVIPKDKQAPPEKTTTVAEPINVANGNMFTFQTDILIPTKGMLLELSRTYNSQDDYQGSFGYGWRTNFDIALEEQPDQSVIEVDEKGVYTIYTKNPDATYQPSAGKYSILTKNAEGTFVLLRKHGLKLYFDQQGKLVKIEDRNLNAINILRTPNGSISKVSDSSGRKLLFTQNSQGKIIQVEDPAGRLFKYEYDSNRNLVKTVNPLNQSTLYQYDTNHNLIQQTNTNGHSLYFEYDSNDRAYHSWQNNQNNEVTLTFDPAHKTTTSTDSLGNITAYEYNDYGLVTKITDSQGSTQLFNWDSQLNKTSSTNQSGSTTAFTYDSKGNLLTVTDPLSNTTIFTYEPNFDFVNSTTDTLGNTTEYFYDAKGNLAQTKDVLNNITNYSYSGGLLTQIIDANNNLTLFDYDSYGNLVQITDTQNNKTNLAYDILGNTTQTTDALGNVTSFTHDSLNRLTQITYPDNSKVTYAYDPIGNLISSVDQNSNTTTYAYDVVDRLIKVTDAQGNTTAYTYDIEGNRTAITDANGNTIQYFYDSLNRLIKTIGPLNNQTLFSYDPVGNLISKTDANGNTINYTFDALNRLLKKQYPNQTEETYSYDSKGELLTAANSNISYTFTYDSLGQLISTTDSNNRSLTYAYDAAGNKTKMTSPEAKAVTYSYDSLNKLTSILDTYNKTTTYAYDRLSRRTKVILPNQTQTSYNYDALNNLLTLTNNTQSEEVISNYAYTYDKVGNRLAKIEPDLKTSYTYDVLYRLTQSTPVKLKNNGEDKEKKSQLETYTYDPLGNRLTSKKDTYSYNSLNQLLNTKDSTYEYDNNGNLIRKTETDEKDAKQKNYAFSYDYENRLIKVDIQKENKLTIVTFTYDPFSRRISKTTQKEGIEDEDSENNDEEDNDDKVVPRTAYYVYDSEDIILEYNQKDKITTRYTHGPGIDEPLSIERNNELYYYHYDGLGSVTSLTDQKQKIVETYAYDSFGNLKRQGNKTKNRFTYTGREWDKETGLYYYRARYYSPTLGRFLQRDPIGYYDSMNLYLYVQNNPLNYFDPFGEDAYYINNKFNTSTPTNSQISHSFVAITDKDPVSGKEKVVRTFSWVNTNGGLWEDPFKQQNIEGAQKAIDIGVGVEKRGDETLDKYIDYLFEKWKGQKGGFYTYRGWCKVQANRLIDDAIKRKAKDAAKKGKIL